MTCIYSGVMQQVTSAIEELSSTQLTQSTATQIKPSDDISLHRISGWALKSVLDNYIKRKSDTCKTQQTERLTEHINLLQLLNLPNSEKGLLPLPVQYLDRGGLTFIVLSLWQWMRDIEIVSILNPNSYQVQRKDF